MRAFRPCLASVALGITLPVLMGSNDGGCSAPTAALLDEVELDAVEPAAVEKPVISAEPAADPGLEPLETEEGSAPPSNPSEPEEINRTPADSDVSSVGKGASGTLKVLITDKPFPFEYIEKALVTLTRVEIRSAEGAAEGHDGPFVVLFEDEAGRSFNLVELQNGRVDELVGTDLPPGRYSQLRLFVTEGHVVLRDGREFNLRVPGGEESGIKLHCDIEVRPGAESVLLLDVDLSRAFSPIPGGAVKDPARIREFRFSPSLAMRLVHMDESGSIAGTVRDVNGYPIPTVAVTAYADGAEVTSTATSGQGEFKLIGLPAGVYSLEFTADGYESVRVDGVIVSAGEAAHVGDVVLPPAVVDEAESLDSPPSPPSVGGGEINYALNAQVTLHGPFFSTKYYSGTASDPQSVVDGIFLPRRTPWDQGTVWWVMISGFNDGQYLTIDLDGPSRIESVVVQTYTREAFVLSYWDLETESWKPLWYVPRADIYATGMDTHPVLGDETQRYVLPEPVVTTRLKFAGGVSSGTHLYSVSEIQAYGRALNSPPVADAGGPYVAPAASWEGASIPLAGDRSYDPDGDELAFSWRIGEKEIGNGPTLIWDFSIGTTVVSLTVTDPAGASDTVEVEVTVSAIEVAVDIKPGSADNPVNLTSKGVLPVAFLTDEGFDAARIDPATVTFAGYSFGGFVRLHGKGHQTPQASLEDVDGDGDADLVVHLETALLPFDGTETECTLGALTWEGELVRGSDVIRFVGPKGQ